MDKKEPKTWAGKLLPLIEEKYAKERMKGPANIKEAIRINQILEALEQEEERLLFLTLVGTEADVKSLMGAHDYEAALAGGGSHTSGWGGYLSTLLTEAGVAQHQAEYRR